MRFMPDIFISHCSADRSTALKVQKYLQSNGATTFVAPCSIESGKKWSDEIRSNLQQSRLVLFLASRTACASDYVNQELGGQWLAGKKIVPVVWDMPPEELPGWTKEYQAVDLRNGLDGLRPVLDSIVQNLRLDKNREGLFLIAVVGFIIWLVGRKK